MAERIRLSRARGWRLPPGAVSVARPGKWGNPFIVGRDGTRLQSVAMFAILADGFIDCGGRLSVDEQLTLHRRIRRSIGELQGRDLACWCALDGGPCHADVLLWLANKDRPFPLKGRVDLPRVRLGMAASDLEAALRKKRRRDRVESSSPPAPSPMETNPHG